VPRPTFAALPTPTQAPGVTQGTGGNATEAGPAAAPQGPVFTLKDAVAEALRTADAAQAAMEQAEAAARERDRQDLLKSKAQAEENAREADDARLREVDRATNPDLFPDPPYLPGKEPLDYVVPFDFKDGVAATSITKASDDAKQDGSVTVTTSSASGNGSGSASGSGSGSASGSGSGSASSK
jgi:hypothetical protein